MSTGSEVTIESSLEEGWLLKSLQSRVESEEPELFRPLPPKTWEETGLRETQIEALLMKFLWNRGTATVQELSQHHGLPFNVIDQQVRRLKEDRLIAFKRSVGLTDYQLEMTEEGTRQARRYDEQSSYFGAAPVPFAEFLISVQKQSLDQLRPTKSSLSRALSDLAISQEMLSTLGQALTAGRAIFLYGTPGNGKTSIAERVTAAFGKHIWIPRALDFDGDIVRLFDPIVHTEVPDDQEGPTATTDRRWVRIERPTIVVGGELTMDHLEVAYNSTMGISEAPTQLKATCGTFVIDDFGRQRMSPTELLNRWIVPLEKRYDFLNLPSGKKIQVPFDQLLIFSTNLEPKEIVDEAFLRRIPYKLEVNPPTEPVFRKVFQSVAEKMGVRYDEGAMNYLLEEHYRKDNRPFRFCQPRDLLTQVNNYCLFHEVSAEMKPEYLDAAASNYFGMM